jgi:hypothetical protein
MKWLARLTLALVVLALLLTAVGCGGKTDTGLQSGQRISAKEAWAVMQADVAKWKAGSMIIECRQPARRGKEDLGVDGLSSAWRFIVGPAGDGNQAYFSLDTTAEPIKPNRSDQVRPAAKAVLDPATWTIDSPKAMEIALANGLQEFIDGHASFEVRMMTFEIDITVEQGPFWKVEAKDGSDTLALKISAADGSILP